MSAESPVASSDAVWVSIESLRPFGRNTRRHTPEQISALMSSLQTFGQRRPLVVRRATNEILAGHGVYEAAKALGWETVWVYYVDDDDSKAMAYNIADNRLGEMSEWDYDQLRLLGHETIHSILQESWVDEAFELSLRALLSESSDSLELTPLHDTTDAVLESLRGASAESGSSLEEESAESFEDDANEWDDDEEKASAETVSPRVSSVDSAPSAGSVVSASSVPSSAPAVSSGSAPVPMANAIETRVFIVKIDVGRYETMMQIAESLGLKEVNSRVVEYLVDFYRQSQASG